MPLFLEKEVNQHTKLAVWEITENKDYFLEKLDLTDYDNNAIAEIKFDHRLKQWLSSRYLIKYLVGIPDILHLSKDEYEKPVLLNVRKEVSLSHTDRFAAVIVSDVDVGIDIESYRDKIIRLAGKFMYEEQIEAIDDNIKVPVLSAYWSMKESLYKFYAKGKIDFKTELEIPLFEWNEEGEVQAKILKNGGIEAKLSYMNFDGHVLTWVVDEKA